MSNVNSLSISGRLTADPETIANGKGARFSMASNRSYRRDGSDEWEESVVFLTVTAWNGLGKRVMDRLTKGAQVFVSARLELSQWESSDGQKRQQLRAVAFEIDAPAFFGPKDNGQTKLDTEQVQEGAEVA
jgi:single stranded DNA-binding protein